MPQAYSRIKRTHPGLLIWIESLLNKRVPVKRIQELTHAHIEVIEAIRSEGSWLTINQNVRTD